ncbi:transketolase [Heliobacterium gestii]|uniref:Transketolase n=1 Tax=Heliomicrobium gestii TaxID=2699 RepID=A0A845LDM4_HELGE|nr:transketolase C-terminal domain-containing protein [Heliomicrobium gestii]MBM7866690.1 transketolase [Heliomicrobium gestii]MZP43030.1 transketolase [Heliomicrobium gestii]
MRNAYLSTLYDLASENPAIMALVADNGAIVYDRFRADFPNQFINFGIAEANMVSAAAGLASCGKIPFCYTIIPFLTMRAYEQVRNDVCLQKQNVKLVGIGAGCVYSTLGPTHHAIEDLAIMRVLPNMTIFSPASPLESKKVTAAAAHIDGPVYLRLGTGREPEIYDQDYDFQVGKGIELTGGDDVTLFATGSIAYDALQVARELAQEGIGARVINLPTIKPIDAELIVQAAQATGAVLTVEEHNIIGGLGSAVSEVLMEAGAMVRFARLGIRDHFCKGYGAHGDVKKMNGVSRADIAEAARSLVRQK